MKRFTFSTVSLYKEMFSVVANNEKEARELLGCSPPEPDELSFITQDGEYEFEYAVEIEGIEKVEQLNLVLPKED